MDSTSVIYHQVLQDMPVTSNDEVAVLRKTLDEYNKALMYGGVVSKTDPRGIITFVSEKFSELSGYLPEELIGHSHSLLRHPSVHKNVFKDLWLTIKKQKIWSGVMKNQKRSGEIYFAHTTIIPVVGNNGETVEYISMMHDISELLSGRKAFPNSYKIDMLTGVGNRIKFFEDLAINKTPNIALINIRDFKEINSVYGVDGGDTVLEQLADCLQTHAMKNNIETYRLNGDEFVLIAEQSKIKHSFTDVVIHMGMMIEEKNFVVQSNTIKIKISVGISLSHTDTLLYADIALKESKKRHRLFTIADQTSTPTLEYKNTLVWKQKIIDGIKEDRFVPFYQPIIDNESGKVESYEALIRLREGNEIISPAKFLDIAKYANVYCELTRMMIRKTFDYFHHKETKFSLNLNIDDIQNNETRLYLKKMLYQYSGIQRRLTIELVESEGIENFDEVTEYIKEMKQLGCQIAIDDFGTGYSNFEYLMKLNADVIKIDGSLIQGMATNENLFNIVETIVQLARKNKLKTVAEFVSSAELYEKVKTLGIDYSQGYYLKEPSAGIE